MGSNFLPVKRAHFAPWKRLWREAWSDDALRGELQLAISKGSGHFCGVRRPCCVRMVCFAASVMFVSPHSEMDDVARIVGIALDLDSLNAQSRLWKMAFEKRDTIGVRVMCMMGSASPGVTRIRTSARLAPATFPTESWRRPFLDSSHHDIEPTEAR